MRSLRLETDGLVGFEGKQVIEFGDGGIVEFSQGIINCVELALYGLKPEIDVDTLVKAGSKTARVSFTFSVTDQHMQPKYTFLVERIFRAKKNETKANELYGAELFEIKQNGRIMLANTSSLVSQYIKNVLGKTREQFKNYINEERQKSTQQLGQQGIQQSEQQGGHHGGQQAGQQGLQQNEQQSEQQNEVQSKQNTTLEQLQKRMSEIKENHDKAISEQQTQLGQQIEQAQGQQIEQQQNAQNATASQQNKQNNTKNYISLVNTMGEANKMKVQSKENIVGEKNRADNKANIGANIGASAGADSLTLATLLNITASEFSADVLDKMLKKETEKAMLEGEMKALSAFSILNIGTLERGLKEREKEVSTLKGKLADLEKTKANSFLLDTENYDILTQRQVELEYEGQYITDKEDKLKLARAALSLTPLSKRLQKLRGAVLKDRLASSEAGSKLDGLLKNLEEANEAILEREAQLKQTSIELIERKAHIQNFIPRLEVEAINLKRRQDLLKDFANKEAEYERLLKNRAEYGRLKDASERYLKELRSAHNRVVVSPQIMEAIKRAWELEIKRDNLEAQLKAIEAQDVKRGAQRNSLTREIDTIKTVVKRIEADLSRVDSAIEKLYDIDEKADRHIVLTNAQKEAYEMEKAIATVKILNDAIALTTSQNEKLLEKIDMRSNTILDMLDEDKAATSAIARLEEQLTFKLMQREDYLQKNSFAIRTANLNEGDSCPVCSTMLQKNPVRQHMIPLEAFDSELQDLRTQISQTQHKKEAAIKKFASLTARSEENKRQIDNNLTLISAKELERDNLLTKWSHIGGDTEQMYEALKMYSERVEKLESLVASYVALKNELHINEKNHLERWTKLDSLNKELFTNSTISRQLNADIAQINMQYYKYADALGGGTAKDADILIKKSERQRFDIEAKIKEQEDLRAKLLLDIAKNDNHISECALELANIKKHGEQAAAVIDEIQVLKRNLGIMGKQPHAEIITITNTLTKNSEKENKLKDDRAKAENAYLKEAEKLRLNTADLARKEAELIALESEIETRAKDEGFEDIESIQDFIISQAELRALNKDIESHKIETAVVKSKLDSLKPNKRGKAIESKELDRLVYNITATTDEIIQAKLDVESLKQQIADAKKTSDRLAEIKAESDQIAKDGEITAQLYKALKNGALDKQISPARLNTIINKATSRLVKSTSGRYELEAQDNILRIVDNFKGRQRKELQMLSDDEFNQVVLALANAV